VTLAQDTLNDQTKELSDLLKRAGVILLSVVISLVLAIVGFRQMQASEPYIREVLHS
jgi:predicted negative regulator of RcsB-dependent stress response